jgi:DNA-nicking Smr family endonuclease
MSEDDKDQEPDPDELFRQAIEEMDGADLGKKFDDGPSEPSEVEESSDARGAAETEEPSGMARSIEEADVEPSEEEDVSFEEAYEAWEREENKSGDQKMREALEGLSAAEMQKQKYSRQTSDDGPSNRLGSDELEEKKEQLDDEARQELEFRQQKRQFEQAMHDVERKTESKPYRDPSPPDPSQYLDGSVEETWEFVTPRLPKSGDGLEWIPPLDETQKQLKTRHEQWAKKDGTPELNIRGETVSEALPKLEQFVRDAWEDQRQFVRVVHGKGKQSEGNPVLKPAVLKWLENDGGKYVRGYIPKRDVKGNYGSLIIEIRVTTHG